MINSLNNSFGSRFTYLTQNTAKRQDPDTYAKEYANQNGISLEEAKAELKAKYGDPQIPEQSAQNNSYDTKQENNYGISDYSYPTYQNYQAYHIYQPQIHQIDSSNFNNSLPNQDPDTYAKEYANQNGISFEDAKAELSAKYGDPQIPEQQIQPSNSQDVSSNLNNNNGNQGYPPEVQGLADLGVPYEVIQEGDDAIMNFLKDNDITNYEDKESTNPFSESNYSRYADTQLNLQTNRQESLDSSSQSFERRNSFTARHRNIHRR